MDSLIGRDRVMFGTDNPFFPPLDQAAVKWESVESNLRAIEAVFGPKVDDILYGNAERILNLQ